MTSTHEHEKKQFKRLFQQQGVDQFDLRFAVLEAFLKLEHHVTIEDVISQLQKDGVQIDAAFVDNSMELLCRFGFATKIEFEDRPPQYEHRHLGLHHDHMVCTKCGSILEFKDEAIETQQQRLAEAYGFHMLQHKMEIYGICATCMAGRSAVVSLHNARQGEHLIVAEFETGKNIIQRMSSMGLRIGDRIEVVSSGFGGQVVIAAGDNRLVLGKGVAQKVRVRPYTGAASKDSARMAHPKAGPPTTIMLSQMKAGQKGVIKKVSGESVLRRRLLEMGINRGTEVFVEKYAPLKDPVELVVKGYHISLRVAEAANIIVEQVR
jgi:Fur family ferric uptake transcriptional regulator